MRKLFTKVAIAAAVLAGFATSSHASLVLTISDTGPGGATRFCDNSTAATVALCTANGFLTTVQGTAIAFNGNVGLFNVAFTSSTTNIPGTSTIATLDQSSTRVVNTTNAARGLFIDLTGFGFTAPVGTIKNVTASASLSTSLTTGGTVMSEFFVDADGDATPGEKLNGTQCMMNITNANACTAPGVNNFAAPGNPFDLRLVQTFTLNAGQDVNSTANMQVTVPEPMSTSLVGAALVALALTSRRRGAKQA